MSDAEHEEPSAAPDPEPSPAADDEPLDRIGEAHEELEEEVQPEGVDAVGILNIGLISLVVLVIVVLFAMVLVERQMIRTRQQVSDQAQYPLRERVRSQAEEKLTGYEPVSGEEDLYRIPIERAMEEVAGRYGGGSDGE